MPDLQAKWHGAPLYVWYGGGTVVLVGGYILYKRRQAAKAAAATPSATGTPDTSQAPTPTSTLGTDTGWFNGSSPTGSIIGYDSSGNPIYSGFPGSSVAPGAGGAPAPQPAPVTGAPPAPVVGAGNPADQYAIGQTVNPASGEKVVAALFSPVYGWINETNMGGIYTGGGGQPGRSISQLPYGGSYLGYVAQKYGVGTPAAKAEIALHGTFGPGGLAINPGGGYTEINTKGERYQEGP